MFSKKKLTFQQQFIQQTIKTSTYATGGRNAPTTRGCDLQHTCNRDKPTDNRNTFLQTASQKVGHRLGRKACFNTIVLRRFRCRWPRRRCRNGQWLTPHRRRPNGPVCVGVCANPPCKYCVRVRPHGERGCLKRFFEETLVPGPFAYGVFLSEIDGFREPIFGDCVRRFVGQVWGVQILSRVFGLSQLAPFVVYFCFVIECGFEFWGLLDFLVDAIIKFYVLLTNQLNVDRFWKFDFFRKLCQQFIEKCNRKSLISIQIRYSFLLAHVVTLYRYTVCKSGFHISWIEKYWEKT